MRPAYQERQALGCRVQICLVADSDSASDYLLRELWLELLAFEKRCSRFLPDSELSRFNRAAGVRQPVSAELYEVLWAARQMSRQTEGLFNPFILPALQRAGYTKSRAVGHELDESDSFENRTVVQADKLDMGEGWASIPYGTAIDLGGCGKGYIGDTLAQLLVKDKRVRGFWLSIGGDTISHGFDQDGKAWKVYLQPNPADGQRIGEVSADGGAMMAVATSSSRYRRGSRGGKQWHHLIDPRTGRPAETTVDLAVVRADSLLVADVLASCVIIDDAREVRSMIGREGVQAVAWQGSGQAALQIAGSGIVAY